MTKLEQQYFKGEEHRLRGDLEKAISFYEQALQVNTNDDTLYRLGCCYLKWGQVRGDCFNGDTTHFRKAESIFLKLISEQEEDSASGYLYEVRHNLGEAQYHTALTILQAAPENPEWQKLMEQAINNFKDAIKLNPGYAESYHWLGNALQAAGLVKEALEYYEKAIELNPKKISYYYPCAVAQEELGLAEEAEKSYNQAINLLIHNIN